jgi:hypothetical protein
MWNPNAVLTRENKTSLIILFCIKKVFKGKFMKRIMLLILGLVMLFSVPAAAYELPQFDNATKTKIRMPGGIFFGMPKDKAIALLRKRHPLLIDEDWAGYEFTKNGIRETYGIRFNCNRVWMIHYAVLGPLTDDFYNSLSPFTTLTDKLKSYYSVPVEKEDIMRAKLLDDKNIKLDFWTDSNVSTVSVSTISLTIELYWGDQLAEPECDMYRKR